MESQLLPVYISKLREIQYAVRQQSIIATQQVFINKKYKKEKKKNAPMIQNHVQPLTNQSDNHLILNIRIVNV